MKILIGAVLSLLALNANAALVSVEPDDFAAGTNIENAYAGVTLSVEGRAGAEVFSRDGFDANPMLNRDMATTGTLIFGNTPVASPVDPEGQIWDEATFGLLRVDFDVATDFVSIDLIFGDDGIGRLSAYDSGGNLLDSITESGDGRIPSIAVAPVSILWGTSDIAYILAGGVGAEPVFLDNMQYNASVIPIPATVWLFGSGLISLIGLARRKTHS